MKVKMFRKGHLLKTLMAVVRACHRGEWLYLGDRVIHPSWIYNMTLATIMMFIRREMLRSARRNHPC